MSILDNQVVIPRKSKFSKTGDSLLKRNFSFLKTAVPFLSTSLIAASFSCFVIYVGMKAYKFPVSPALIACGAGAFACGVLGKISSYKGPKEATYPRPNTHNNETDKFSANAKNNLSL